MKLTELTTGAQTLTAAGVAAAGLDISALSGDYMLQLTIAELKADAGSVPSARVVIEDTIDNFDAVLPLYEKTLEGAIVDGYSTTFCARADQIPGLRIGAVGAKMRARVVALGGTNPSITLHAALHHN